MCQLEWVVEGQVITGEEEQFTVDMEELDEDGDQFTSAFTTLTMLPQENKHKQLSATCRFSIFGSLSLSAGSAVCSICSSDQLPPLQSEELWQRFYC